MPIVGMGKRMEYAEAGQPWAHNALKLNITLLGGSPML
jgi:hypothetical protein